MPPSKTKGETVKEIVEVDKDLDDEFRSTVAQIKGLHKGVLRDSFQEAVRLWIKEQKKLKKEYKQIEKE